MTINPESNPNPFFDITQDDESSLDSPNDELLDHDEETSTLPSADEIREMSDNEREKLSDKLQETMTSYEASLLLRKILSDKQEVPLIDDIKDGGEHDDSNDQGQVSIDLEEQKSTLDKISLCDLMMSKGMEEKDFDNGLNKFPSVELYARSLRNSGAITSEEFNRIKW